MYSMESLKSKLWSIDIGRSLSPVSLGRSAQLAEAGQLTQRQTQILSKQPGQRRLGGTIVKTCVFPTDHPEHIISTKCAKKHLFYFCIFNPHASLIHCTIGFLKHCTLGFIPGVRPECPEQSRALSQCLMCPVSMLPSDWSVTSHTAFWLVNTVSSPPLIGH